MSSAEVPVVSAGSCQRGGIFSPLEQAWQLLSAKLNGICGCSLCPRKQSRVKVYLVLRIWEHEDSIIFVPASLAGCSTAHTFIRAVMNLLFRNVNFQICFIIIQIFKVAGNCSFSSNGTLLTLLYFRWGLFLETLWGIIQKLLWLRAFNSDRISFWKKLHPPPIFIKKSI